MQVTRWQIGLALLWSVLAGPAWAGEALCAAPGSEPATQAEGIINGWWGPSRTVPEAQRSLVPGQQWLPLDDGRGVTHVAPGDLLLLIQMQDAVLKAAKGQGYRTEAWRAGHFEWVRAAGAVSAGRLRVLGAGENNGLVHAYPWREPQDVSAQGRARWQLVRVPQYDQVTLSGTLTALPWNGDNGGVLALDVRRRLDLNGFDMDVSALGFRGGAALRLNGALGSAEDMAYRAPTAKEKSVGYGHHASKGEGMAGTPRWVNVADAVVDTRPQADRRNLNDGYPLGSMGKGAPANAGGGGNGLAYNHATRSGGGGAGNGHAGTPGTDSQGRAVGGEGGQAVPVLPTVLMTPGGGGGAGVSTSADDSVAHGGTGGGMIFLQAGELIGQGRLLADGGAGHAGNELAAGGGGGAGGAILLLAPFGETSAITLSTQGGVGGQGDGQGGTGGDGVAWLGGGVSLPAVQDGALPGRTHTALNVAHIAGALPGYLCAPGGTLLSGQLFEDNGAGGDSALDAIAGAQETGLAGWHLEAVLAASEVAPASVLARVETNQSGQFALELPEQVAGQAVRVRVLPPDVTKPDATDPLAEGDVQPRRWQLYSRYEGAPVVHAIRWHATGFDFTPQAETHHADIRLGWLQAPVLDSTPEREVARNSTEFYLFRYRASADGEARFHYQATYRYPERIRQGWQHTFFLDPDCDQASEYVDTGTTRWVPVEAGQAVCVRVRVEVQGTEAQENALDMVVEAETRLPGPGGEPVVLPGVQAQTRAVLTSP